MTGGYGDIVLSVGDSKMPSLKYILCYQNEMLKSLIDDPLRKEVLELSAEINANSLSYMNEFYSGKEITIDVNNVVDILSFCVCYSDHRLIASCMKCLKEIISNQLIIDIFQLIPYLNSPDLLDLEEVLKEILSSKSNDLLFSSELKELTVDSVEYILRIPCLQIETEDKLLKSLFDYYENIKEHYEDLNELKEDFKKLIFPNINWNRIKVEEMDDKYFEIINKETIKKYQKESSPLFNRIYICDYPEISEDKILCETLKEYYYSCPSFETINDETMCHLHNDDVEMILKKYLRYKNVRFKIGCLLLISHLKIELSCMNMQLY